MSETGRNRGEKTRRGRKRVANERRKADGVAALCCKLSASSLGMKPGASISSSLDQTLGGQ